MPTSISRDIPDYDGNRIPTGFFRTEAGMEFQVPRFDRSVSVKVYSALSESYSDNAMFGAAAMEFNGMAASNGWGGMIDGASLNVDNTTVIDDSFELHLFSKSVAPVNGALFSTLVLTSEQADSYIGAIIFGDSIQSNSQSLFRATNINQAYTCNSDSTSLYGILTLAALSNRIFSSNRIAVSLQFSRS